MKKLFALALVVLGFAACQTEPEGLDVNMDGTTTISVVLPEDAITRATAADETNSAWDGLANTSGETLRVIFQVYDEDGATNNNLRQEKTLVEGERTANFDVRLVPGRKYTFVAWADQGEAYFDATDLKDVKIASWEAMDECRDAFTATHTEANYTSASDITLELTRPFAKLRVVTTDMAELGYLGIVPAEAEIEYSVALPNAFNAYAGKIGETAETKSFTNFDIAEYNQDAANTMTLFTDYILVPADGIVKFSIKTMQDGGREIKTNNFNTDIPVQRNHLTTIMGNVLTEGNNITVTVEEDFAQPELEMDELSRVAMFEGGKYTLTEDVVLTSPLVVKQNMVLDLNGHTITAGLKQEGRHHYAIDNYGTLTLEGEGAINARGIENFGTMTINGNITITNVDTNGGSAIWNEGNIVINGGTFTTNAVAGEGSYGGALSTQEGGSAVINGGNFIANSQLTYAICNYGETVINNATVKGKHGAVASANNAAYKTTINGGSFELMENPNVSDHCVFYVSEIKGGEFTLGANTDCGAQVFYASTIATGYKAIEKNGKFYVVSEEVDTVVASKDDVQNALKAAVAAGETEVVIDANGANINLNYGLKTATVPAGTTVTIRNAAIEGKSYGNGVDGTIIFEGCTFNNSGAYSIHFDNGNGNVIFKNCDLYGWNSFGASLTSVSFEDCTLTGNGTYALIRSYADLTLTNCVINTSNANHNDGYSEGVEAIAPATLTENNVTYVVENPEALKAAVTEENATVNVAAGDYTFPSSVAAGVTIKCEEGTVFTGTSSLNIKGATVIGAEFNNEGGVAVKGTINGTFKNCTFVGEEALRWCYAEAGETIIFEDCVIKTDFRGFHFDGMAGDVIFRNCEINGFNAYGGEGTATFEGCTIGCDESSYAGLNIYSNTNLVNCTFNYVSGKTNFIDMEGTGKTLKITNCKVYLDGAEADIKNYVGGSQLANNTVIYE